MTIEIPSGVAIIDFSLVRGVNDPIEIELTPAVNPIDVSTWVFELATYAGAVRTVRLTSTIPAEISVDNTGTTKIITLKFVPAKTSAFTAGRHTWDLRATIDGVPEQLMKGTITVTEV